MFPSFAFRPLAAWHRPVQGANSASRIRKGAWCVVERTQSRTMFLRDFKERTSANQRRRGDRRTIDGRCFSTSEVYRTRASGRRRAAGDGRCTTAVKKVAWRPACWSSDGHGRETLSLLKRRRDLSVVNGPLSYGTGVLQDLYEVAAPALDPTGGKSMIYLKNNRPFLALSARKRTEKGAVCFSYRTAPQHIRVL